MSTPVIHQPRTASMMKHALRDDNPDGAFLKISLSGSMPETRALDACVLILSGLDEPERLFVADYLAHKFDAGRK